MIIKSKDDIRPAAARLRELLALTTISAKQREALEAESVRLRSGAEGGKQAAYYIDFELKDSRNWAVIHDLRVEHNGRVAQIDHLLIGRFFDIFVIESKHCKTALRVDGNGEFQVNTRFGWKGIPSPIEQNRRHIVVLNELISQKRLTPMRLGLSIKPDYRNWILVPPQCDVSGGHLDGVIIHKTDMFHRRLNEFAKNSTLVDDVLSLPRISSSQTIMEFARKLVTHHRPASVDYAGKFGISKPLAHPRASP